MRGTGEHTNHIRLERIARAGALPQRLFHEDPPSDGKGDPLDRAQQLTEEELWLATVERAASERLQEQEAEALRRIGRYGRCVECDASIPPARLQACPWAIRCVPCQTTYEESARGARRVESYDRAAVFSHDMLETTS